MELVAAKCLQWHTQSGVISLGLTVVTSASVNILTTALRYLAVEYSKMSVFHVRHRGWSPWLLYCNMITQYGLGRKRRSLCVFPFIEAKVIAWSHGVAPSTAYLGYSFLRVRRACFTTPSCQGGQSGGRWALYSYGLWTNSMLQMWIRTRCDPLKAVTCWKLKLVFLTMKSKNCEGMVWGQRHFQPMH